MSEGYRKESVTGMHSGWMAQVALASLGDGWLQGIVIAALTGLCAVGGVVWLAKRRWEPALQQLTTLVEREMHHAEQSAQALRVGAQAQALRAQRQAASVHGAIAGVRALHSITEELDHCATDLKHLAQIVAAEGSGRRTASLADHVVTSAQQLALTAEQAHQTYRRLQASINQLVAEATSSQDYGHEAEHHARELTGAVERLMRPRQGAPAGSHQPRIAQHQPPGDPGLFDEPRRPRSTTPRDESREPHRQPLPDPRGSRGRHAELDEDVPQRHAPSRHSRSHVEPEAPEWSGEDVAVARAPGSRRPARDTPIFRRPHADGSERATHRRDDPAPRRALEDWEEDERPMARRRY